MIKPVFELKDWTIARLDEPRGVPGLDLFANHYTCTQPIMYSDSTRNEVSWLSHEPPVCWACEAPVPDEIQALLKLHEWDK